MVTHSSILAWRIPMDRGAWWVTVHGVAKSGCEWTFKHNVEGHSLTRVSQKYISIQNLFWCKSLVGTPISSGLKIQNLLMCFSPLKKSCMCVCHQQVLEMMGLKERYPCLWILLLTSVSCHLRKVYVDQVLGLKRSQKQIFDGCFPHSPLQRGEFWVNYNAICKMEIKPSTTICFTLRVVFVNWREMSSLILT